MADDSLGKFFETSRGGNASPAPDIIWNDPSPSSGISPEDIIWNEPPGSGKFSDIQWQPNRQVKNSWNNTTGGGMSGNMAIRDSHTASNTHLKPSQQGDNIAWAGIPRPKFLFGVRFFKRQEQSGLGYGEDRQKNPAFVLKYIDRPKVSFDTETMNQYNKKRLVYTQVKYEPITMRFYDSVDDRVLDLIYEYCSYYFGDFNLKRTNDFDYDVFNSEFWTNAAGWGYSTKSAGIFTGQKRNFFDRIELYHFFGGQYNKFIIENPKIVSFDHDSNDYEQGQQGTEITLTMQFEGIIYEGTGFPVDDQIASIFGFEQGQYSQHLELSDVNNKTSGSAARYYTRNLGGGTSPFGSSASSGFGGLLGGLSSGLANFQSTFNQVAAFLPPQASEFVSTVNNVTSLGGAALEFTSGTARAVQGMSGNVGSLLSGASTIAGGAANLAGAASNVLPQAGSAAMLASRISGTANNLNSVAQSASVMTESSNSEDFFAASMNTVSGGLSVANNISSMGGDLTGMY